MTNSEGRRVIDLIDRSQFFDTMNGALEIDPTESAVLTIDMHRGHLDPDIATMPVLPETARPIVVRTASLLASARAAGLTIIHSITVRWEVEARALNPFQRVLSQTGQTVAPASHMDTLHHNIEGSAQCELMTELGPEPGDFVLSNKKQFSAFHANDLDRLLRLQNLNTLVLLGVGTNTCILSTAFDASSRGYKVVVIADCTVSLNGEDLHLFGLENIQRTIGWVLTSEGLAGRLTVNGNAGEE